VPSAAVVAAALNLLVRKRLPVEVFEHLGERPFSIEVRDLDLVMAFRYSGRRFVPVPCVGEAALRFRVNASDFATLAAPEDAPDGRFLHDLVVIGAPDIAAEVRNVLDGIDVVRTRRILRRAVRMAVRECQR
jgi:predicted lipid carrier protein YhbT